MYKSRQRDFILDNLNRDRKTKPMVIVMDRGYAVEPNSRIEP